MTRTTAAPCTGVTSPNRIELGQLRFPGPTICLFALSVVYAPPIGAAPTIVHAGLECIAPGRFAIVLSGIDPGSEIQTAKVHFRSELYPDFYYVAMKLEGDRFVGILPQAAPSTPRVIYYLEAIDQAFESVRSEEFGPVVGECDDDPALGSFPGGSRRSSSEPPPRARPRSRRDSRRRESWERSRRRESRPAWPRESGPAWWWLAPRVPPAPRPPSWSRRGATSGFREGSLRVVQGNVVAMRPRLVTLSIGEPEERFRIRFELE